MAWACLAVLATQSNSETIDIAEEAFANINHYEKVYYIQYIKVTFNCQILYYSKCSFILEFAFKGRTESSHGSAGWQT